MSGGPDDLLERYVAAVRAEVPAAQRDAAERELRARIAAAVAARGAEPDALRQVLNELGDPVELAQEYGAAGRMLIGPALYPTWSRLLATLLIVIVPLVLVVVLIVNLWDPARDTGTAVLEALGAALQTAITIAFAVTLAFAVIERVGGAPRGRQGGTWDVAALPRSPRPQIGAGEVIPSLVFLAALIGLLVWQRSHSSVSVGGQPLPFLAPDLWGWWIPGVIALLLLMMGVEVWKYIAGRWTLPLVLVNVGLNAVFGAFIVLLLQTQRVVNAAFAAAVEETAGIALPEREMALALAVLVVLVCVWDSVDSVLKYLRGRKGR